MKHQLTRKEKDMMRNYPAMSSKNQRRHGVIILTIAIRTVKAKLGFNLTSADGTFITNSVGIYDALTLDSGGFFGTPFALMSTLQKQNVAFQKSIDNMALNILGAAGAKSAAKRALKLTLDAALAYVNELARLDQANAVDIITSAKMLVIPANVLNKQDFTIKQTKASGGIKLISLAGKFEGKAVKTSYDWQVSIDAGVTWVALPSTLKSTTVTIGMVLGVKTIFRKRITTVKGGTTEWVVSNSIMPS